MSSRLPLTFKEYLTLMEAMDAGLARFPGRGFYYLSRAALVKDERNLDKFDRVFDMSDSDALIAEPRKSGCAS